jgi:phosphatidylglycerophosphatase A
MTTSMSSSHSDNGDDKRIGGQIDGRPAPEPEVEPTPKSEGPELLAQPEPARPRPNKNFVRSHPAHFIAFGGGAGLSPVAPGTAGTLVAFPLFWMLALFLDPVEFLLLIVALFIIGIWACSVTGKALGNHDHGGMVWDEITAFLLILLFTPHDLRWQASAFPFVRYNQAAAHPILR